MSLVVGIQAGDCVVIAADTAQIGPRSERFPDSPKLFRLPGDIVLGCAGAGVVADEVAEALQRSGKDWTIGRLSAEFKGIATEIHRRFNAGEPIQRMPNEGYFTFAVPDGTGGRAGIFEANPRTGYGFARAALLNFSLQGVPDYSFVIVSRLAETGTLSIAEAKRLAALAIAETAHKGVYGVNGIMTMFVVCGRETQEIGAEECASLIAGTTRAKWHGLISWD
jgi:hypothetical protein